MSAFLVEGGHTLSGDIRPTGNKNAALPCIAAALLTSEPVTLDNVPRIRDVDTLLEIVASLGVRVEWTGPETIEIEARDLALTSPAPELAERIRASILIAGPLLARLGRAVLAPPGGDIIGRRRLDTHFLAFRGLGAEVTLRQDGFEAIGALRGADIFLDEPSVTATENAVMAAVLAKGTTRLRNAAAEPHVQDLCRLLLGMGAKIDGVGTHVLEIEGVERLGGARLRLQSDHIETGSFIGLAAVTGSVIRIREAPLAHLDATLLGFSRLGVECEVDGEDLIVLGDRGREIRQDAFGHVPKVDDGPWPAFPADLISIALVTATQCHGTILVHEKMFESRMFFTDKLVAMGARIILCDPHRAVVVGPSPLRASPLESPDIRAGMALLLAALAADGTSRIENIRQIERGYERIDERLRGVGARIERVPSHTPGP
ncbi:MAG: UDP-N-acetylglucosamine 1-carboxyvinyltransferase [Gemmatimonadota bacterium]